MSVPIAVGPSRDVAATGSHRGETTRFPLRSVSVVPDYPETSARRPPSTPLDRRLVAFAALGYAVRGLSVAGAGRRVEALAAVEAARELLSSAGDEDPSLAVQIRVAIARTAIMIGDLDAARSDMCRAHVLVPLLATDDTLRRDAEDVWEAINEQCDGAPIGSHLITAAEARVLSLLPHHSSYKEIASSLHISPNTVKSHAYSVYRKLGVGSRSEAVRVSRRLGLVAA